MKNITDHPKWRAGKLYGHEIQKETHEWKIKHQNADEIVFHKDGTPMFALYTSPAGKQHYFLKDLFKVLKDAMHLDD